MDVLILQKPWFVWGLALVFSFPLLVIVLGEAVHRLRRRGKPLAATLAAVRNLVLPILVVLLVANKVLGFGLEDYTFRLIATLFWIAVIHAALSFLNMLLFAEAEESSWRARVPALLRDLTQLFLVLIGTAIVLSTVWEADLAGLLTALGVGSIVLGLALQDTLGNVFSGIAMLFEAPFRVGDKLRIEGQTVRVLEINWRAVRVETRKKEMLVVPNSVFGQGIIQNLSRPQPIRAESMGFSFSYDDPPNRVKRVLRQVALATEGVLAEPEPEIFLQEHGESAISYEVEVFVEDHTDEEEVRDELGTRVWYAAKRHGLTIPYPTRTVYTIDAGAAREDGALDLAERLRSIPALVPVERQRLEELAQEASLQHFGQGERIVRQGDLSEALYIILDGLAVVAATDAAGEEQELARLERGEFFGEMALLRRAASTVSVTAAEDLEVVALYPDAVHAMLESAPRLARQLSATIEARREATRKARGSGAAAPEAGARAGAAGA